MVVVTALIGDVLLGIWWLFQLAFMRWNPTLVYNTLRWIVVLFLLPIGYVAIKVGHRSDYVVAPDSIWQETFLMNEQMMPIVKVTAVIWLVTLCGVLVWNMRREVTLFYIRKYHILVSNPDILEEQKRIQEILGIKKKITIFQNPYVNIPYTSGYFKKVIVLPCADYSREQIAVILYHEMTHVKKHDLFFKTLGRIVAAIQCMNPCAYLLIGLLDKWSECDCDAKAIAAMEEECTSKQYYKVLYDMAEEEENRKMRASLSMLVESRLSIEGRIEYMSKIKNAGKASKVVTVMLTAAFILMSTSTAYAAGVAVAEVSDKVFAVTEEVAVVDAADATEDTESEWFLVTAEESANVPTVSMESDIMFLGSGTFDWDVPAGVRYVTGKIYLHKGDVISLNCSVRPTTSTYWLGVMLPNGNSKVTQGTGTKGVDIEITSDGYYKVMVQNLSDVEIDAVGGYIY